MKNSNLKSFTLIELMVAVFILTVAIVGVLAIFPLGLKTGKSGEMASLATQLAQAKIEEIISQSYGEILVGETTEEYGTISDFPSYKRQSKINYVYVDANKVLYPDQEAVSDSGVKKIEVKVFWKSPFAGLEKDIKIANLISKK